MSMAPLLHGHTLLLAVTPPGFKTSGGVTEQCPPGFFRADWLQPALATECHACGEGVKLDPSERLTVYDSRTGEASQLAVGTTDEDCCKWGCLGFEKRHPCRV